MPCGQCADATKKGRAHEPADNVTSAQLIGRRVAFKTDSAHADCWHFQVALATGTVLRLAQSLAEKAELLGTERIAIPEWLADIEEVARLWIKADPCPAFPRGCEVAVDEGMPCSPPLIVRSCLSNLRSELPEPAWVRLGRPSAGSLFVVADALRFGEFAVFNLVFALDLTQFKIDFLAVGFDRDLHWMLDAVRVLVVAVQVLDG